MSLPSATVLGAVGLGAVGAVLAAGAALSAPNPSPRSDQQPVVVTTSTPLPCPAGTEERGDSCVKVVVAPADPAPAETHRAAVTSSARSGDSQGGAAQQTPEAEPSESPESPEPSDGPESPDGQDGAQSGDGQDSGSGDGAEGGG